MWRFGEWCGWLVFVAWVGGLYCIAIAVFSDGSFDVDEVFDEGLS